MRQFLYQAWHEKLNLLFVPDYINSQGQACGTYEGKPIWSCQIRQFTGIQDHKGVDAYEYDIIAAYDSVFKIVFSHGGFVAVRAGRSRSMYSCYFEVIGNLFQNPDLFYKPIKKD